MTHEPVVRFGPFEFDLESLELRKSGRRRRLQQQPASILRVLIDHADQVVTRDALRRHLWADDTFVDFDLGLNAAIRKLRVALGESPERPRFIETVARRGYRFRFADERLAVRRMPTSIAVLPFETANLQSEYLSDGITEIVIQSISVLPGVRKVIARNSVYRYRGRDPVETGRRFNVQAVLAGRIDSTGERIVLDAELLASADGHRMWGNRYERPASEVPKLVADMCESIAIALGQSKRSRSAKTPGFDAYRLYLQGRYAWNKRPAVGAVDKAISLFDESMRLDPESHLPLVGLADSYNTLAAWESGSIAPQVGFVKAKEAATHALRLCKHSAEAHASLGYANLHYDWDLAAAEKEFNCALRLNPNYSHAHHWYSHLLIAAGRADEALAESHKILELDPLDLIINVHLAWHYYMAGKPEQALAEARRVLDMEGSFHWGHFFAGLALDALGERHDAIAELDKAVELSGRSTVMVSALGYGLAAAGQHDRAIVILDELEQWSRSRYVSSFEVALIHAALGEVDEAFSRLDRAYDERSGWLPYAAVEPRLVALRSDARFGRLLEKIRLAASDSETRPRTTRT
jgi:TolB-like protein/Flp pilus assembly protein TadD